MIPRDAVLQQALELAPEDRAFVADQLERSLTVTGFATEEIAVAWAEEINRRIDSYDRGETTAISLDESLERMQEALAAHPRNQAQP